MNNCFLRRPQPNLQLEEAVKKFRTQYGRLPEKVYTPRPEQFSGKQRFPIYKNKLDEWTYLIRDDKSIAEYIIFTIDRFFWEDNGMRESEIESYLKKRVEECGGITRKLVYQGRSGAPDRMCVFPYGLIYFVELKAPKKTPRPGQQTELNTLKKLGQFVTVLSSKEAIDEWIKPIDMERRSRFISKLGD